MAKWDKIHLEMSNILTAYLYKYSSQKITKLKQKNKALKNKADSKDVPVESSPTIFIESSWVKYSQGDKNTFFRTVFAHTKYNDTGCLNEFFITSESKMKRYLNLHDVLERLNDDDLHIGGNAMTEEMRGVANYLRSLHR